ncbi:MAG: DUF3892 domain-containing protein [Candidatus Hodarchaeota archaeon]
MKNTISKHVKILITAVHLKNGNEHKHISDVKWENTTTKETNTTSVKDIITFLIENPGSIFVQDKEGVIEVCVINDTPKYIRTKKDDRLTDNLLYLPRF